MHGVLMRYHLIVGMTSALPLLIVESLYIAIILALGTAATSIGSHKRHERAITSLARTHQADLELAFLFGLEVRGRHPR